MPEIIFWFRTPPPPPKQIPFPLFPFVSTEPLHKECFKKGPPSSQHLLRNCSHLFLNFLFFHDLNFWNFELKLFEEWIFINMLLYGREISNHYYFYGYDFCHKPLPKCFCDSLQKVAYRNFWNCKFKVKTKLKFNTVANGKTTNGKYFEMAHHKAKWSEIWGSLVVVHLYEVPLIFYWLRSFWGHLVTC